MEMDGEVALNVGIRKKGFIGSQSIDKPALKINVDEFVDGAELFGVDGSLRVLGGAGGGEKHRSVGGAL